MFNFLRRLWKGFLNIFRPKKLYLDDTFSLSSDTLEGEGLIDYGYFIGDDTEI